MPNEYDHVSEKTPNILTQKHMRSDQGVIVLGTAANRPTAGNSQTIFYFATDTFVMSYWDSANEVWKDASAFT
ncbi:MAG: hypothetical protein GY861_03230 [bacterium]|nr:hypothetical protein [bacterium]